MRKPLLAIVGLLCVAAVTLAAGQLAGITLPNGWLLSPTPPHTVAVGTLPTGIVLARDGSKAFVLETGFRKPQLRILDARTLADQAVIPLPNAYGAPLRDPAGDGMWIANTQTFGDQVAHFNPALGRFDRTVSLPVPFSASALARSPNGKLLAVTGDLAGRVALVDLAQGTVSGDPIAVGLHPAAVQFSADGRELYVANRGERSLDVIDVAQRRIMTHIRVGLHPAALLVTPDRVYAADTDDDDIAVIDPVAHAVIARVPLPFALRGVVGASPNAIVRDGYRLYVTCGAANAVAVFKIARGTLIPLGAIPAGWYPTAIAVDSATKSLLIVNGKGEGGHPNSGYRSGAAPGDRGQYVAAQLTGSVRRIPRPSDVALRDGLADVLALGAPFAHGTLPPSPVVRAHGPISHVIYIVKENRSYDQILGDDTAGDGDPSLVWFGREITPNQHALADRFGLFDRFFVNAHVSADGHNWSMGAFANDYLERMWPANYANRRPFYDFDDGDGASIPHAGFLWDDAARHKVSFRDYGEWVTAGPNGDGTPTQSAQRNLQRNLDPRYPTFDLTITDVSRVSEWKREFDAFERSRTLPALEIVRLPRDHTAGTRVGENTPQAMVADNDRAVGLLVDAVSHSPDWGSTAIFILEDDAQDGPDHVDEQRSTLYIASPYAAGGLRHEQYTTASVLRTMEIILGLSPMSPYDAGAVPLNAAFTATPDLRPFDVVNPGIDLNAKNAKTAYRAADSARMDFAHADDVNDDVLNDILKHAVAKR
jgi:YVTN family beta-propeller protein